MDSAEAPRLIFERSGGFGGLTLRAEVSGEELSGDELTALQSALAARPAGGGPSGPDQFQYDLTLVEGGRSRHATFYEGAVPDALRPLIARLKGRAAPG
jgi:hypothetical protein